MDCVAGVAIAVAAIAILLGWDVQIQFWLAPFFPTQELSETLIPLR
ncbi:hypothetical protein [Nostoc sp.]